MGYSSRPKIESHAPHTARTRISNVFKTMTAVGISRSSRWLPLLLLVVALEPKLTCEALQTTRNPHTAFRRNAHDPSHTLLFTATSSSRSKRTKGGGDDYSSASAATSFQSVFLEDTKGQINPELAQRIFRWERSQRLNLQVRSDFSTRQGLRWVQDLVATYSNSDKNNNDDLIQEGVVALMHAMTTYEREARPTQSFEAFSKERIQRAVEDYQVQNRLASSTNSRRSALSVESTVEIADPLETHYSNQDEWEVREGLVLDNGQGVKPDELVADFLDETLQYEGEDQMWVHQQQVAAPLRDSIPAQEEDDATLGLMTGDDALEDGNINASKSADLSFDDLALRDMIVYNVDEFLGSTLDDLESQVIQLRFGLDADPPKAQKEVAFELDISISKVRKVQKQALRKLRNAYSRKYVEDRDETDQYYHEDSV